MEKTINIPTTSLNNIDLYFKDLDKDGRKTIYIKDVRKILHFLRQSAEDNNKIVGVGYKRFDNKTFAETPLNLIYEGGFAVEPLDDYERKDL